MPDLRQDAALAAATTVWHSHGPTVLPLTVALPSIQGVRHCNRGRWPRLSWTDDID